MFQFLLKYNFTIVFFKWGGSLSTKKNIFFIGNLQQTTQTITKQLNHFLGQYIDIKSWCLEKPEVPTDFYECDLYITSSYTALAKIENHLLPEKKVIVAARALDTKNLDDILELTPGTTVLVAASSEETAKITIHLMQKIGIDYLEVIPYHPQTNKPIPSNIEIAITTGLRQCIPPNVKKVIDLGVKGLDLSTYVEIIIETDLPRELINNISQYYLKQIFNLSRRKHNVAELNNNLKRKLEVIINTVDEAMLALNKETEIILINSALENLLGINRLTTIGKKLNNILPQVDLEATLKDNLPIVHNIQKIKQTYFILSANPILDKQGNSEGVVVTFKPVGEVQELETKVRRELKQKGNIAKYSFSDIIGKSAELQTVKNLALQFSKTDLTVLIEGESGTGKELFAQAIHNSSSRKYGPFVAINFAALPENLVESELFGYEEGAFTGAKRGGKPGLFEEAHNGTIFLDEIGDASLDVQKKLLRVLEEREVRRVGGRTITPINVRVIAATNQNLEHLVKEKHFRSDLFYRLCTLPLSIPPLRTRGQDILILFDYFAQKLYKRKLKLEPAVKVFLENYSWPGNIRELENVVKYMCSIIPINETVSIHYLPVYLNRNKKMPVQNNGQTTTSYQENFELILQELDNQGLLKIFTLILQEIASFSALDKGLGRTTLAKRLQTYNNVKYLDHQLKKWFKTLTNLGLVSSGKTKQGTRITPLGQAFLEYLKNK